MEDFFYFFITILIIFYICNKIKKNNEISRIKSNIDEKIYIVRKLPDEQIAADKLAKINQKIKLLLETLQRDLESYVNYKKSYDKEKDDKHSDDFGNKKDGIKKLIDNYNPDKLSESAIDAKYTSYSVNKGEDIYICLRHKHNDKHDEFMNDNIIIFVVIHELAHVMTKSVGHTEEFWDNMRFLLEISEKEGIYQVYDYSKHPEEYCGIMINSTPYNFKK
jgi:predicted metal-dependent hydrolase